METFDSDLHDYLNAPEEDQEWKHIDYSDIEELEEEEII